MLRNQQKEALWGMTLKSFLFSGLRQEGNGHVEQARSLRGGLGSGFAFPAYGEALHFHDA